MSLVMVILGWSYR